MRQYLTLHPKNQFVFTCPVFDAETKMASCMALREAVWMGKIVEKRIGCQVAMKCSMCPAAAFVDRLNYSREAVSDDYGSMEPKKGKLHFNILSRIRNVIPIQAWIKGANLTENERHLLQTARERIEAQIKTAPGANSKTAFVEPRRTKEVDLSKPASVAVDHGDTNSAAIKRAAASGDMAAAINNAA